MVDLLESSRNDLLNANNEINRIYPLYKFGMFVSLIVVKQTKLGLIFLFFFHDQQLYRFGELVYLDCKFACAFICSLA